MGSEYTFETLKAHIRARGMTYKDIAVATTYRLHSRRMHDAEPQAGGRREYLSDTEAQCMGLLARLDKLGFIEPLPNNRYRTLVAKPFKWLPDGLNMRRTKTHANDYFNHLFTGPGEMLRVINVRLARESRQALISRLEQVALEYAEQHNSDSWLPMEQRHPLSLCLTDRPWEPEPFRRMRRRK